MSETTWPSSHVRLAPHPLARDKAVATHQLHAGLTVVTAQAFSTVLLPSEKGRRCDACFCRQERSLKRCTGCASYWYCDINCQNRHWNTVHKFMCKHFNRYQAAAEYQVLQEHEKLDSQLLSHLFAEHQIPLSDTDAEAPAADHDLTNPLSTFLALYSLSLAAVQPHCLPICPMGKGRQVCDDLISRIYERFGNNNFSIHSHLAPIAHGVFPLASRLFNHSCKPNAVAAFTFGHDGVCMHVRTIATIEEGEEITMAYVDPALPYHRRGDVFRYTYGFSCACPSCTAAETIGLCPEPPKDAAELAKLEKVFLSFVFPNETSSLPSEQLLSSLPPPLHFILHETYIPRVSSAFSNASHDGPYDRALPIGRLLLAIYVVVYPPGYPQIGSHCLEMAKTAWNAVISGQNPVGASGELLRDAYTYTQMSKQVLLLMGREGDDGGPLEELETLEELIRVEGTGVAIPGGP